MRPLLPLIALVLTALPACSSDSAKAEATSPADASDVVVNEMNAAGVEWLELYNKGARDFDLGAYGLADTDKDTGRARTTKAMRFPSGTKLQKGGVLLVLLGKKDSTPGPYSAEACLAGVDVGCFYALFSVSESRGEAIHLLAADNTDLSSTIYPANLAFDAGSGLTACRIPDGTGDLTACRATPGAANEAR